MYVILSNMCFINCTTYTNYTNYVSYKPMAGIGGRQVPREGVKVCRERSTNVLTVTDITEMGLEAAARYAGPRSVAAT